jgi:predicted secreted protein
MGAIMVPDGTPHEQDGEIRSLSVRRGATFPIHLWEDRTRGELWVPSFDPAAVALVNDEFLRIASNNAVDQGRRTFEFQVRATGTHRVVFEKRMGWKFTAEDRRVFLVGVTEEAAPVAGE